jgi:hypothetical protein
MRFSTCNVRGLCRSGFLTIAARELGRYKFNLVGVQEVSWDKGGMVRAGDFLFEGGGGGNKTHELGTGFFVLNSISS